MYLVIRNRGTLNRNFVEYIGYTNKTADGGDKIGQFGTGAKFASVAALRLGLHVHIASSDHEGQYVLRFEKEAVDLGGGEKTDRLRLRYWIREDDGQVTQRLVRRKIVIDAFRDWTDPIGDDPSGVFRIVREFITNAQDADTEFTLSEVDKPAFAPEGEVRVYIPLNEGVREVMELSSRYFKFLTERQDGTRKISTPGVGTIYDKSDPKRTRVFVRGVMVMCSEHFWDRSCLDYSLDSNDLVSEDRTVKNASSLKKEIGRLISSQTQPKLVRGILEAMMSGSGEFEKSALGYVSQMDDLARLAWMKALEERYGTDKLVLPSGNRITDQDVVQVMGYVIVHAPYGLNHFFTMLGIPNAKSLLPPRPEYTVLCPADFDEASLARLDLASRLFAKYFPERLRWPIVIALAKDEQLRTRAGGIAGVGDTVFEEVWLLALSATELRSVSEILRTFIHESRHCVTTAYDYDRKFGREGDHELLHMLYRCEGWTHDPEGNELPALGEEGLRPTIIDPNNDDGGDAGLIILDDEDADDGDLPDNTDD